MKIINLVKSEFIKNYNIKKMLIICLILTICSSFLVIFSKGNIENNKSSQFKYTMEYIKMMYNQYSSNNNRTFKDNFDFYSVEKELELLNIIDNNKENDIGQMDWATEFMLTYIMPYINQNYIIEKMLENPNEPFIIANCISNSSYEQSLDGSIEYYINNFCNNYEKEELINLQIENNNKIEELTNILKEDKYYLYINYMVENNLIEKSKFTDLIIEKKIETNNGIVKYNYKQYENLEPNTKIDTSIEYFNTISNNYTNKNYELYKNYQTKLKNEAIGNREIVYYSSVNNIPHDISFQYDDHISEDERYMNTKLAVNQIFHLSAVIMIIVSITSSGIISSEHSKGTIKNLVTAPIRRWKILLSKFIYLILNTYVLWILSLFIISIVAGLKYGFTDLFTPKLIWNGNKVIEVNYYLYLLKDIFIASIPMICFMSILFCLSGITLNTSLTVGITTAISVLSPIIWLMSMVGNFKQIVYIPIWYFDLGFIFNNSYLYNQPLQIIKFSLNYGISICLITTIILYLITSIIYIKRDIKN